TAYATIKAYTLSLHDALPIYMPVDWWREGLDHPTITTGELLNICKRSLGDTRSQTLLVEYMRRRNVADDMELPAPLHLVRYVERSEEHTSELQSRENLVCRLL